MPRTQPPHSCHDSVGLGAVSRSSRAETNRSLEAESVVAPERRIDCWACGAPAELLDDFHGATGFASCPDCGLVFRVGTTLSELKELYGDEYFRDCSGGSYVHAERARRREATVRVRLVRRFCLAGRLLEIGAADGTFLDEARGAGYAVFGVEPSEMMAGTARARFGLDIATGFVEEVPLPVGSFDVACAWHVVEHIANPLPTLVRVREALRPNGVLLLEVPNLGSARARRERGAWDHLDLRHHVGHFGPRSLSCLLRRAGLAPPYIETVPRAVYLGRLRARASHAKYALVVRGWPGGRHPTRHELLRAVARVPE
jgi:SAM-dependent methyltransferase